MELWFVPYFSRIIFVAVVLTPKYAKGVVQSAQVLHCRRLILTGFIAMKSYNNYFIIRATGKWFDKNFLWRRKHRHVPNVSPFDPKGEPGCKHNILTSPKPHGATAKN